MHENRLAAGALPQTPLGDRSSPPRWWGGGCLPYNLGPSGLAPYRPKSLYQNSPMLHTLTDCLMLVILCRIRPCSCTVLLLQQFLVSRLSSASVSNYTYTSWLRMFVENVI